MADRNKNKNYRRPDSGRGTPNSSRGAAPRRDNGRAGTGVPIGRSGAANERKPAKRRKGRRRSSRRLTYALWVVILLAVGAFAVYNFAFKVQYVTIVGTSQYSEDQIISAAGIESGSNLLKIDKGAIKQNIESKLTYIGEIKVGIVLPDKVKITLLGTQGLCQYKREGGYVVTDSGGNVKWLIDKQFANVLLIKGASLGEPTQGMPLEFTDPVQEETLIAVRDEIDRQGIENITEIDISDTYNIVIVYDGRIKIILGSRGELEQKLSVGAYMIDKKIGKDQIGELNLSIVKDAYFKETTQG